MENNFKKKTPKPEFAGLILGSENIPHTCHGGSHASSNVAALVPWSTWKGYLRKVRLAFLLRVLLLVALK